MVFEQPYNGCFTYVGIYYLIYNKDIYDSDLGFLEPLSSSQHPLPKMKAI